MLFSEAVELYMRFMAACQRC